MQTPSEPKLKDGSQKLEWAARSEGAKRSVFGNYSADDACSSGRESAPSSQSRLTSAATDERATLQSAIDLAIARAFIHRFLAKAYEDPTPEGWQWLCDVRTQESLRAAWAVVAAGILPAVEPGVPPGGTSVDISRRVGNSDAIPGGKMPPSTAGGTPAATFSSDAFDSFHSAYLAAFGHAARGQCPLNEIEYGDLKADPLFQPHRLADLAAFYCAFGLEVAGDADERQDHICLELEFTCVLAAKEAYALENQLDAEELALCRDAQKKFLREHLGRWTPAFARRLASTTTDAALRALAEFTRVFIESECARFAVNPGGEDLLLRPVDEAAESMCASCGIPGLPPGALPTT